MLYPQKTRALLIPRVLKISSVRDIVICPGSRNAPLILALAEDPFFNCISIADERCAGYYALGTALAKRKPSAIICTSGTAAVNFYPAVAEAFYQQVPLIVITADRPPHLNHTLDGQTLDQSGLYGNHVRYACTLSETPESLAYDARLVTDCLYAASGKPGGPVHINIPFSEPLYDLQKASPALPATYRIYTTTAVPAEGLQRLSEIWQSAGRKLIIAGQKLPDRTMDSALQRILNKNPDTAVIGDLTANLQIPEVLTCIDGIMDACQAEGQPFPLPDAVIYTGGAVISKKLKTLLRCHPPTYNVYIGNDGQPPDVFFSLTDFIRAEPSAVFSALAEQLPVKTGFGSKDYRAELTAQSERVYVLTDKITAETVLTELCATGIILNNLPKNSIIHLGNSLPVRLAQYFRHHMRYIFQSNRGTGGIDGCISTAAGYSQAESTLNILLAGDVSFLYDSNALAVRPFPQNLIVFVINNNGGGIFRAITGASSVRNDIRERFFAASQNNPPSIEGISAAYGLKYRSVRSTETLKAVVTEILSAASEGKTESTVVEVFPEVPADADVFNIFKHCEASGG